MNKVYEIITEQFIEALESDLVPWRMPFILDGMQGSPKNIVSNKGYSGLNVLLLAMSAHKQGFRQPGWLTFNQVKGKGGTVTKGQKSSIIVFYKKLEGKKCFRCEGSGCMYCDGTGKVDIPMLRYYRVFNIEQTDLEQPEIKEVKLNHNERIERAEELKRAFFELATLASNRKDSPKLETVNNIVPCYNWMIDTIKMPEISWFSASEEYYSTLFHEMVHSTAKKERLNRKKFKTAAMFPDKSYSFEELVAEIGAAFLCSDCNILPATIENSKSYCKGWAEVLQSKPKWIVQAAALGAKAARYINPA